MHPPPDSPAQSHRPSAHAALAVCQFCFGLFPLFGKWAFDCFGPGMIAGWRVAFGSAVFLGIAALVHRGAIWMRRGDVLVMTVCAFLGIGLNQALFLEGLKRSTAVNTGLMMMLIPLFTFGIAVLVRQEEFSLRRGLGILVALAGTSLLVFQDGVDLSSSTMIGNLLLIGNTLSYACFLVAAKPLMKRYPPLVFTAWMYALSLWVVPFVANDGDWVPETATGEDWTSLWLILLFPTVIAYLLNLYALRHVRASTIAVYVFTQPLIAGIAGVLVLGEEFRADTVLAAACILGGLWIVVSRPGSR